MKSSIKLWLCYFGLGYFNWLMSLSQEYGGLRRIPVLESRENWKIWKLRVKSLLRSQDWLSTLGFPSSMDQEEEDEEAEEADLQLESVLDGRFARTLLDSDADAFNTWVESLDSKEQSRRALAYSQILGSVLEDLLFVFKSLPEDPAWIWSALWCEFEVTMPLAC